MMKSHSESSEQIGFVNWFRQKFPGVMIMHIPNGGYRAMSEAKKMRFEGVLPGVPDLFVPEWGLWIEMKRSSGGRLSAAQKDCINNLEGIGHVVIVGNGARDASEKVLRFLTSD